MMIGKYIKQHTLFLILALIFTAICLTVFFLFGLPMSAVLYAALLCAAAAVPIVAYDYYRWHRRVSALMQVLESGTTEELDLPKARGAAEEGYAAIIERLRREKAELNAAYDRRLTDIDDYYTLWAHQIKTPIAAMSVLLQQEDGAIRDRLSGELFKIERYVELALQYLRLDSMSGDLVLNKVSLDSAVRQTVRKFARLFIHSRLSIETSGLERTVVSDEKWLCFILEQIVSNSIKYTPSGTVKFTASENKLTISDTGIGINSEDLPRIFERGFTGFNGRMDKKSTGLGLYLSSKAAKKLSIDLCADSVPGEGTSITLVFPEDVKPE